LRFVAGAAGAHLLAGVGAGSGGNYPVAPVVTQRCYGVYGGLVAADGADAGALSGFGAGGGEGCCKRTVGVT